MKTRRRFLARSMTWATVAAMSPKRRARGDDAPRVVPGCEAAFGGIVRGPKGEKRLALIFTGHEFAEGAGPILDALAKRHARGSFFLTGDFLANPDLAPVAKRIVADGHYLGPHSDKHLLYCEWGPRKRKLVTREAFEADLSENLAKIARLAPAPERPRYFLPPYEHYDRDVVAWSAAMGLTLVNFTPGTRSNADYMPDDDPKLVPSAAILDSILDREAKGPDGLNGFLLLLHIGVGPKRTDKFHALFADLLDRLAARGYAFVRVDELLDPK